MATVSLVYGALQPPALVIAARADGWSVRNVRWSDVLRFGSENEYLSMNKARCVLEGLLAMTSLTHAVGVLGGGMRRRLYED